MGVIITPHCSKIHSTFGVKITPKRELKYWSKKYSQIGVNWDLFFLLHFCMPSTFKTLLGRLISLQIFQAATLPNVPSHVAKCAHSSRRLKIPSFVQRLFKIFETFHIRHLQRDPSGMRFRLSVPTFVAPMPT